MFSDRIITNVFLIQILEKSTRLS